MKTLYLGACRPTVTLKACRRSPHTSGEHAPSRDRRYRRWRCRQTGPSWRGSRRPEHRGEPDFWHACEHLQVGRVHRVAPGWFEKYREIRRGSRSPLASADGDPRPATFAIRCARPGRVERVEPSSASIAIACARTDPEARARLRLRVVDAAIVDHGGAARQARDRRCADRRSLDDWLFGPRALIKSGRPEMGMEPSAQPSRPTMYISPPAAALAIAAWGNEATAASLPMRSHPASTSSPATGSRRPRRRPSSA